MAAEMEFTTAKRRDKKIKFKLDGEPYVFTAPKQAPAFLSVVEGRATDSGASINWFWEGMGEEQAAKIRARLNDPEDDYDMPNLDTLMRWLAEQVGGRPTT